ncbi:MAG: protein kinase [Candidatus Riflebacteria bacterium]|nr:protein kinase [Candidatus Riflebacteria bacterium]
MTTSYKLLSELGHGGMGVVYRALQMPLEREVAVKFLLAQIQNNPDLVKRFKREVSISIKLAHPNIIKIIDSGEMDGKLYYVMEFLSRATPLNRLIKKEGPFPPRRALDVALQLLDALDYCHAQNILHRDIKPANVMVDAEAHVTLMDFGLVKDTVESTLLTEAGRPIGTPRYMSPEVIRGIEHTAACDLWAVGAVLYEMLTKRPAFPGRTVPEISAAILKTDPIPLIEARPDLPGSLEPLVMGFLKKDLATRLAAAPPAIKVIKDWLELDAQPRTASPARQSMARLRRPSTGSHRVVQETGPLPVQTSTPSLSIPTSSTPTFTPTPAPTPRPQTRKLRPAPRAHVPMIAALGAAAFAVGLLIIWVARTAPPRPPSESSRPPQASPTPVVVAPAGSPVEPVTVTGLRWDAAMTQATVSFTSSRPGAFVVEAASRSGGLPPAVFREKTSELSHEVDLSGLIEGTTYRLRVVDDAGNELVSEDVTTLTLPEIVAKTRKTIASLDPAGLSRSLLEEWERVARGRIGLVPGDGRWEPVRKRWDRKIQEALRAHLVDPATRSFARVKDQAFKSTRVPAADKLELFERIVQLRRLEEIAVALRVPAPKFSERLTSPEFSQVPTAQLRKPAGFAIVFEGDGFDAQEIGAGEPFLQVDAVDRSQDTFFAAADPADAEKLIGTRVGRLEYVHPTPIPLPPRLKAGLFEVHAAVTDLAPANGFRILTASEQPTDRTRWRLLACLKRTGEGRHVVFHTVPPDLLADRPIYLKVEFDYSSLIRAQGTARQSGGLKWLFVAYQ